MFESSDQHEAVRMLTEQLVGFDTADPEGIQKAAGFISGWLEARGVPTRKLVVRGLPILIAEVGDVGAPTVVLHGHVDVVPGKPDQFEPRVDGDRLLGRGTYDMKGALAAMMLALCDLEGLEGVGARLAIVPDEESEEEIERGSDVLVEQGFGGDFAITGEPTDLHIGIQAKGVLALRVTVDGVSAHGSTPWLGENAILRAVDMFRAIESLPFARQSSELFDRPSINLGRIVGGDALNKVPDRCVIDLDIRHLPDQDPAQILSEIRDLGVAEVRSTFTRRAVSVDPEGLFVRALCDAASPHHADDVMSIGRDGASDAVYFLAAGIPAVEFGPIGGGHHGPEEWVSIPSLTSYKNALTDYLRGLPERFAAEGTPVRQGSEQA